jgi:hypothetical protein
MFLINSIFKKQKDNKQNQPTEQQQQTQSSKVEITQRRNLTSSLPKPPIEIYNIKAGNKCASISFSEVNAIPPVTQYYVFLEPGGNRFSSSASPIFMNGLTNGKEYKCRIQSLNPLGISELSLSSPSFTPCHEQSTTFSINASILQNEIDLTFNFIFDIDSKEIIDVIGQIKYHSSFKTTCDISLLPINAFHQNNNLAQYPFSISILDSKNKIQYNLSSYSEIDLDNNEERPFICLKQDKSDEIHFSKVISDSDNNSFFPTSLSPIREEDE